MLAPVHLGDSLDANACGPGSLYVYLRFLGKNVTLAEVHAALPPPSSEGHSIAEIQQGAAKLGVTLRCYQKYHVREPAIAFLRFSHSGHFVVLRPIGDSGTLIQMVDPIGEAFTTNWSTVTKYEGWTGVALVRYNPTWDWLAWFAVASPFLLVGYYWLHSRRRFSRGS